MSTINKHRYFKKALSERPVFYGTLFDRACADLRTTVFRALEYAGENLDLAESTLLGEVFWEQYEQEMPGFKEKALKKRDEAITSLFAALIMAIEADETIGASVNIPSIFL